METIVIMTNCCYIVGPRVNLAEKKNQVKSKQKIERPGKFYPNLEIHFSASDNKLDRPYNYRISSL